MKRTGITFFISDIIISSGSACEHQKRRFSFCINRKFSEKKRSSVFHAVYFTEKSLTDNCITYIIHFKVYYTTNTVVKMISFENFRPSGEQPVYQQIILNIKRRSVSGEIRNGDELPSRRTLSALLGINPNTVQKAFHLLEEEGLIESRSGAKSCMVLNDAVLKRLKEELLKNDLLKIVSALRETGISREEAVRLIGKYWEELS